MRGKASDKELVKEVGLIQNEEIEDKFHVQNGSEMKNEVVNQTGVIKEHDSNMKAVIAKQNIFSATEAIQTVMNKQRKVFQSFDYSVINYMQKAIEQQGRQQAEFEKKITITTQLLTPAILKQLDTFNAIKEFSSSMNKTLLSFREKVASMQPTVLEVIKGLKDTMQEINATLDEDKKIKAYSDNPFFWKNVRLVSKDLIVIPEDISDEVLDYLCKETCNFIEVKRLIGKIDVKELESELEVDEHKNYMFKDYLLEIIQLHKSNPDNYRVYIPALFTIIEGTLSEIFKISERGTASEIKRKMNVIWDLYHYVYLNQTIGVTFSFWNQLLLTNTKEIFNRLTVNSKDQGMKINRNAILHGKSNPYDWTYEDFTTLVSLIQTILFTRRTTDILTTEFLEMIDDEFYDEEELTFTEYEISIRDRYLNEKNIKEQQKIVRNLKKDMRKDLCHLFAENTETTNRVLDKSNFSNVIERLFKIF